MSAHLLDRPLADFFTARRKTVERMAADLVRFEAFRSETDAIRSLYGAGYPMLDIVVCVDDARQAAMQQVVAREMSGTEDMDNAT